MSLITYIKRKLERKKARRTTQEYSSTVTSFDLGEDGIVEFANWDNPLVKPTTIDRDTVLFWRQFIKSGDLIIDIGANIGDTTVPMALAAGKQGTTLAFDPNPLVFKILETNARLNPLKTNIVPHRFAISAGEEEFFYISSEASFGNGGISPTRESRHGKFVYPEKIKGIDLKKFLLATYPDALPKLSMIKIDTEGYDKEIIKSIADLLASHKPYVIAESFGKSKKAEKQELFNVLDNLGYDVYYFEEFDIKAPVRKITSGDDLASFRSTINIYGTPRSGRKK